MKYVNQKKYPHWLYVTRAELEGEAHEKGKTTTIFTSGCGICSAVMVAHRLIPNCEFELQDAIDLSYECKANNTVGTNYHRFVPAFAEKLGFDYETTNDPERLRYCLRTGGAAVVGITGDRADHIGAYSTGGHYIVAISEERDGRIATLDPSFRPDKYDKEGVKGLIETKYSVLTLSEMDVLMADTENPKPKRFFLFWRK